MTTTRTFDSLAEYSEALTSFLSSDATAEYRSYRPASLEEGAHRLTSLQQLLFDEGWSRYGWPEAAGGLGGDPRMRAALFAGLWAHDILIPEPFTTLEILVPVLLVYSPGLAAELLPSLLRGEESWAQAFSEPDAGSDLASLRTKMEPAEDGDGFRVTGQKVWSTFGHLSQRSVMLVRTGEPGHRGLSMVLIDLDQPNLEVRAIDTQDGEPHFAEMFLDGAYVPEGRIIGKPGQGWEIAMYMLQWERGAWGWIQQGRFHSRLQHALNLGEKSVPSSVAELGRAYAATTALRLHTRDTVAKLAREETLGPEVSVDKLLLIDAEGTTWDAIRHHLGTQLEFDTDLHWLQNEFMFSRAAPIYGGSQEIQRTLVAQRVLGMPRK